MANPKHLELAKRGAEAIHGWRKRNRDTGFDLSGANLNGVNLTGANLRGADLSGAQLSRANLSGAKLTGDLSGANLQGANLHGADLYGADLCGAYLSGADLSRSVCGGTVFGDVDLSDVVGLETIEHGGPSTIGVDTLFKSKGIAEVFLRGAGVPEILIEYLHSLTGTALEFYTCFISFTEGDAAFSQRLHNDLQAAGVRCWRWKEDAKWGRTLIAEVDAAIRVYDKLVVILSATSVNSEPVIREIERALQKEQREGKEVLFPIRLDDAVFKWAHALQADVVRKVVGDFREWQNPAKYDAALKRFVTNLRAERKPV